MIKHRKTYLYSVIAFLFFSPYFYGVSTAVAGEDFQLHSFEIPKDLAKFEGVPFKPNLLLSLDPTDSNPDLKSKTCSSNIYTVINSAYVHFIDGNISANILGLSGKNAKQFIEWFNDRNKNRKLSKTYPSGVVKIGPPDASISDIKYRDFLTTRSKRPTVLYVQSNEGLVHGIYEDGSVSFAFIPPNVLYSGRLRGLKWDDSAGRYDQNKIYPRYLLDGPIVAEDVYVNGEYRTFILGLLGLGGAGLYALDVTDPVKPTFEWAVENSIYHDVEERILEEDARKIVYWSKKNSTKKVISHSSVQSELDYRNLRRTVSTPFIGYVPSTSTVGKKEWVFVMGNGTSHGIAGKNNDDDDDDDDDDDEVGSVFIGKMSNGQLLKKMTAKTPTDARPFVTPVAVLNEGARRKIQTFFIGDMAGKIYKGVLDGSEPSGWGDLSLIFSFKDNVSVGISYPLEAAVIKGETWLFAGTSDTERYTGSTSDNYFMAANISRGAKKQSELTDLFPTDFGHFIPAGTRGWSMTFKNGERMSTPPAIYNGYVFFSTFTPDKANKDKGVSKIYVLKADTGEGGWNTAHGGPNRPKFLELPDIKVSGIFVTGGRISLGVTRLSDTLHVPSPFEDMGDNMIVTLNPIGGAGGGIPSGTLRPFYWKVR